MIRGISSLTDYRFMSVAVIAVLLFLLFPAFTAQAATPISGTIPDGTVWDAVGSPYTVEADATVPAGATLVVESGVTVEFAADTGLTVEGSLNVNGTESDPAVFTSLSATPGSWSGILFDSGSAESTLTHVHVSYAGAPCSGICRGGITIVTGPIDIISGRVHDSLTYGIVQYDGLVTVTGTEIDHQPYGFSLAHGTATLTDNIIHDNTYYGVNANAWEGTLTLTDNTFTANASAAARINGGVDLVSASSNESTGSARNGLLMYGFLSHDQTWDADL
ncbi:MAG: right-handed parallel beta-helix repeat-containing protein, partial [Patescibacteria group bacterium]|nr:right-handed parallel beta-helix repeat-containing protein [Patescibacteria group bacterium]